MADRIIITDEQEVRDWAAARAGKPALHYIPTGTGDDRPVLSLAFGQRITHQGDLNPSTQARELVEWDQWLKIFNDEGLALSVPPQDFGSVSEDHEIVKR